MRIAPSSLLAGLAPLIAATILGACGEAPSDPQPTAPPNVLLVVVDTLRADGGRALAGEVRTPWMDRLAAEGVRFPQAFSHAPMTLPAHVALFSSRLPHQSGVLNNAQSIPAELPLLAEHLRSHGYQTHAVTSLGTCVPPPGSTGGLARGFDTYRKAGWGFITPGHEVNRRIVDVLDSLDPRAPFFLFAHFSDPHEPYNAHDAPEETAVLVVDGKAIETLTASVMTILQRRLALRPGRHRIELRGEELLRLRRLEIRHRGERLEPVFSEGQLKIPGRAVAFEFDVPGPAPAAPAADDAVEVRLWLTDHPQKSEVPRRYASEVEHADRQVGRLLGELDRRGLYDDTLVVLTADHGESLGERRFIGHVKALFDELVHVPLIFRLPEPRAGRPAGLDVLRHRALETNRVVGHVDVVPTLLELLELPPLAGQSGRSLLLPGPGRPVLIETHPPEAPRHLVALRDAETKLIYDVEADRFELYDLASDPGEKHDRYAEFAKTSRVSVVWREILRSTAIVGRDTVAGAPPLGAEAAELLAVLGYLE